jgi:glutamyl/glutaminyl-tRNA synthetase
MEKLLWFNREYLKHMPLSRLIEETGVADSQAGKISAVRQNASTLNDLKEYMEIFNGVDIREGTLGYLMNKAEAEEIGHATKGLLNGNEGLSFEELTQTLSRPADLKKKDFFMILRAFITGRSDGPPLKEIFPLVPVDIITGRIDAYLNLKHKG